MVLYALILLAIVVFFMSIILINLSKVVIRLSNNVNHLESKLCSVKADHDAHRQGYGIKVAEINRRLSKVAQ